MAEPTFKNLRELDQNFFQGQFSIISNFQPNFLLDTTPLNEQKTVFWPYFECLGENTTPPWILTAET